MTRKRILKGFKTWALMRVIKIPKVYLRVKFRTDGSYTVDFGMKSYDYLVSKGLYYNKEGKYICKEKCSFWCGQDYAIKSMWAYIARNHVLNRINNMDYVSNDTVTKHDKLK